MMIMKLIFNIKNCEGYSKIAIKLMMPYIDCMCPVYQFHCTIWMVEYQILQLKLESDKLFWIHQTVINFQIIWFLKVLWVRFLSFPVFLSDTVIAEDWGIGYDNVGNMLNILHSVLFLMTYGLIVIFVSNIL